MIINEKQVILLYSHSTHTRSDIIELVSDIILSMNLIKTWIKRFFFFLFGIVSDWLSNCSWMQYHIPRNRYFIEASLSQLSHMLHALKCFAQHRLSRSRYDRSINISTKPYCCVLLVGGACTYSTTTPRWIAAERNQPKDWRLGRWDSFPYQSCWKIQPFHHQLDEWYLQPPHWLLQR